ncbi:MAG: hypothetical protein K2M82_06105 [Lachnospiraceae bacterium]|nr:hypothetical protein [Lachnospiraceae bacterium]
MRKFAARTAALYLFIIICMFSVPFTAYAQVAVEGDTLTVTVSVFNQPDLTSLADEVVYDKNSLELLSYNAPLGISQCNDTVEGKFYVANIFDPVKGMDFTEKTSVLELVFAVKSNISDVEGAVTHTVTDVLDSQLTEVNHDTIVMEFSITPGGAEVYKPDEGITSGNRSDSPLVITPYSGSSAATAGNEGRTSNLQENSSDLSNGENVTVNDTSKIITGHVSEDYVDSDDEERLVSQQNIFKESGDTPTPYNTTAHKRYVTAFIIGGGLLTVSVIVILIIMYKAKRQPARHGK